MENIALRQLLESLCNSSCWKYAVFWKLHHESPMLLTWEEWYYDFLKLSEPMGCISGDCCFRTTDKMFCPKSQTSAHEESSSGCPIALAVADMSNLQYPLGEGAVGEVAYSGNHCWPVQKMMTNYCRTLEVKLISGEDLKVGKNKLVKKNAFAVIRTDSHNYRVTNVDKENGSRPYWNEKFVMDMPTNAKFITVEIHCKSGNNSDKLIGMAKIPVSDFFGGFIPESHPHFLSYRLREASGERNGIVNLSIRVKVPECVAGNSSVTSWIGMPVGEKGGGSIARGIPIWNRYGM